MRYVYRFTWIDKEKQTQIFHVYADSQTDAVKEFFARTKLDPLTTTIQQSRQSA